MSDILNLYNSSGKIRVVQARTIPGNKVNYFDVNSEFQSQFETFQPQKQSSFTERAMDYYTNERENIVIPESFVPTETGINLHRWVPGDGYYTPGQHVG